MANHCKIFTTEEYARELLDAANYCHDLYGCRVLESSCGDGNILVEIVKRYIDDCISKRMKKHMIKTGLERDIIAYEIEKENLEKCIKSLNRVALEYNICDVKWNVKKKDSLKVKKGLFKYIIGNPPYIAYKDIKDTERTFIKETFSTCREGKFDYYYAFIEDGLRSLQSDGILAYIIPSSLYKNVFANKLRDLIKAHVIEIYDYSSRKKFKNAVTSSTMLILRKNSNINYVRYHDIVNDEILNIQKNNLGEKWIFMQEDVQQGKYRFGDYFRVSNCIATLYNKAFILNEYRQSEKGYIIGEYILETELIKNACSRKSIQGGKKPKIIFPYHLVNGNLIHLSEEELRTQYPGVYSYLLQFRKKLDNRKVDKKVNWFEYGRSQALSHMHGNKLLLPAVVTEGFESVLLDEDTIPFAGFYIQPIRDMSLAQAQKILSSSDFWNYISKRSIDSTGKSKRMSVKEIQNYVFN